MTPETRSGSSPPPELAQPAPPDQLMLPSTPTSTPSTTGTVPATAILASGSIRGVSQTIERISLPQISAHNPAREPIFKVDKKWACGTCGRVFVRRNNCRAHEATHRDIRDHLAAVEGSATNYEGPDEWTAIDPFILGLAAVAASAAGSVDSPSPRVGAWEPPSPAPPQQSTGHFNIFETFGPAVPPSPPSPTTAAATCAADVSAHSAVRLDLHQGPRVTLLPMDIQLDPRLLG
ncbi:hypothetical protein PtA15_9A317 [Puccinia triticina]|uniref:C2H2-type domain-containing protein n=1 Tax=Puccinia triticina TaxID=208348 RepID=A0ABY7CUS3_9BASI|nr:uncharacterized protein PtA15_9A317 [Puccinia triticina]WAQ88192.1 hypothetical protein PtA15_9A317 [Puccinia triticina]